jgi:hypothetical protein
VPRAIIPSNTSFLRASPEGDLVLRTPPLHVVDRRHLTRSLDITMLRRLHLRLVYLQDEVMEDKL